MSAIWGGAMRRRALVWLGALVPVGILAWRFGGVRARAVVGARDLQEQAVLLDRLAGSIREPEDARRMVDLVAEIFAAKLPSGLRTRSLRTRMAEVEYAAVKDPLRGIPEDRVARVWNEYVGMVGAPEACGVSAAEVHSLRDSYFTMARFTWGREYKNVWSVPSIYATQRDGTLAPAGRAVESVRVLWDLAHTPGNLRGARERVGKGVLYSEEMAGYQQRPDSSFRREMHFEVRGEEAIAAAARVYVTEHGMRAYNGVVERMLEGLLSG